jgi:hypothetical protein
MSQRRVIAIDPEDPRIPPTFRRWFYVDENLCWIWVGPQTPTNWPSYRHKSAWRFIFTHLFWDIGPGLPPTICDEKACVNPYHRLVAAREDQPHRCPTCGNWHGLEDPRVAQPIA